CCSAMTRRSGNGKFHATDNVHSAERHVSALRQACPCVLDTPLAHAYGRLPTLDTVKRGTPWDEAPTRQPRQVSRFSDAACGGKTFLRRKRGSAGRICTTHLQLLLGDDDRGRDDRPAREWTWQAAGTLTGNETVVRPDRARGAHTGDS